MSKRILAAFLAVMMVVGLLPTTVFAVNSECAVEAQYKDHSKEHCELAGVAYTMVPDSTVAPECGQDGYTLYKCACGDYFADDIIPMAPHYTLSGEPTEARVEPTCFSTGKIAVYTCDECGKGYFNPEDLKAENVDENGNIAKIPHTTEVDHTANDCTATELVCQFPGCDYKDPTHVPCEEHDWVYNNPLAIKKAPTEHDEGLAVFGCACAHCGKTKEVVVHALDHMNTMTLVEAKAPDCKNEGNIEYYHCSVCEKNYVLEGELLVEVEDVTLPITHAWNTDPTIIPPTCETWGFSYFGCPLCGAKKDFTEIAPLGHTYYKCNEHGFEWDAECAECDDALLSYGYAVTDPTCMVDGSHDWKCGRCDKDMSEKIAKTNHKLVKVTVPATCGNAYTYSFSYCTNENCTNKDGEAYEYVQAVEATLKGEPLVLDVTVEVREDGNVYDLPADHEGFKVIGNVTVAASSKKPVHFYTDEDVVQAPDCINPGKSFWYCQGCNDNHPTDLAPLGHINEDKTDDIEETCYMNYVEVCDRCEVPFNEIEGTAGHILPAEKAYTTLPACDGTFGYDWYICERCNDPVADRKSAVPFTINKTYMGNEAMGMNAKEEFEAEHAGFDGVYMEYREGNCVEYGYWKAYCAVCDWTYLVLVDNTGMGHQRPDKVEGVNYHSEATCTQFKGWEETDCTVCGEKIAKEVETKALGHVMTKTAAKAATCTEDGNEEFYTCARECCEGIVYKNNKGTEVWENGAEILPAINHNMQETVVAANCTTPAFVHHICLNDCGLEWVDGYVAPYGHKEGAPVVVEPTCTVDGSEIIYCENAGCTGDDGIAGTADDGILSTKVLPATGHTNKAGETITDICTDTVTDRNCVNKNCPIEKDKNNCRPVGKSHAPVEKEVAAHCKHYGYTMKTCANGCGELDEVIAVAAPLGHLAPWGERYTEEDAKLVDEDIAGFYGEEFLATDPAEYDGFVVAYTAPTYEAMGSITFKCSAVSCQDASLNCGDEVTLDVIRTGVDFTIELDNAAVSGAYNEGKFVDSDVIAVDIYMNAYNTNVWGFNFDMAYDNLGLNYLGFVFHAGDIFGKYMVNDHGFEEDDTVSVSAYTEQMIDGTKVDALVTGSVKVVTLYFQVEAFYTYDYGTKYDFVSATGMGIYNAWMSNSTGDEELCGTDAAGFAIIDMMDTNDNDVYNINDLQNCYDIIKGVSAYEYLASADANKDGIIDLVDLELMNKYLVGAATALDVYAALSWNAPEGFVAG